jgi:hypothetical protein
LWSLVLLQSLEDEAGEFLGDVFDAASGRGGITQSEISDAADDDGSEVDLEGKTGAGTRWSEGSEPLNNTRDDVAIGEDLTEGRDKMTEPEGVESRGREERPSSEASEGNRSREHDGSNGRISYDSERVTRADAAAVLGLKIGFEFELSAS